MVAIRKIPPEPKKLMHKARARKSPEDNSPQILKSLSKTADLQLKNSTSIDKREKMLTELYTNPYSSSAAYTGVESLLREAKRLDPQIKRTDIVQFLHRTRSYPRHRRAVRNFKRLPILPIGLHIQWQADLADFQQLKQWNQGFGFLLVCIDELSRQLFVQPLRRKLAADVVAAFSEIFERSKFIPWHLYSDAGCEFTATPVQRLFHAKDIQHRIMRTSPNFHAGMAERAIRTIKERLWRYFSEKETHCWIHVIQPIVSAINATPHTALFGLAPCDVNFKNAQELREKQWQKAGINTDISAQELVATRVPRCRTKFRVGDRVRIERHKHPFEKGYLPRFTKQIFKIARVRCGDRRLAPQLPVSYAINSITGESVDGWFYDQELSRIL